MTNVPWWVPLLAAVIGGVIATGGSICIETLKRITERRALALAFRGELLAITEIVAARKYVELLEETASDLAAGGTVALQPIRVERNYFPIYSENASKIGALPPAIAERLARTYTYANSFLEDATAPRPLAIPSENAELVEQTLDILKRALAEARATVVLIEQAYPITAEPWWLHVAKRF